MKNYLLASTAILLSGCSFMHDQEQPKTLHYTCGTMPLTVQLDNAQQQVKLILDGKPLTLTQQVSGSGTRYSDGNYLFWSKGDTAFIERNEKVIINDCRLNPG
ncbi:MliC family protein [Erwinia sp. P6884]|uniref:MliC family protein n=1 Tax=Erwinia sp. P6884 TaxID=3141450 RepID=UPI003187D87C